MEHPKPELAIQRIVDKLSTAEEVARWCRRNDIGDTMTLLMLEAEIREIIETHSSAECGSSRLVS